MKFDEYGFHYPADIASIAYMADWVRGFVTPYTGRHVLHVENINKLFR